MLNSVGWNAQKMLPAWEMLNMLFFSWAARPISHVKKKNERNCGHDKHVKLFWVFGTYREDSPISSKAPKKFNIFNVSAFSLTFWATKAHQVFNISPVGSKLWQSLLPTRKMLNSVGWNAQKLLPASEMLNMLHFSWAARPISHKFRKPQNV